MDFWAQYNLTDDEPDGLPTIEGRVDPGEPVIDDASSRNLQSIDGDSVASQVSVAMTDQGEELPAEENGPFTRIDKILTMMQTLQENNEILRRNCDVRN